MNGTTWAAGQWVVRSDRTFTASFTLTGTGAGTRTETGWMIGINTEPLYVTYSSGTQSIAVPTETGLTVNLGANFLRFVR